jgi:hypothetical protein
LSAPIPRLAKLSPPQPRVLVASCGHSSQGHQHASCEYGLVVHRRQGQEVRLGMGLCILPTRSRSTRISWGTAGRSLTSPITITAPSPPSSRSSLSRAPLAPPRCSTAARLPPATRSHARRWGLHLVVAPAFRSQTSTRTKWWPGVYRRPYL